MLLGVISDTHGRLRPTAADVLRATDAIIHAGDVGTPETLAALRALGPPLLAAVRGNVDVGAWAQGLPMRAVVEAAGRRVLVLHDRHDLDVYPLPAENGGVDLVVSGHSHRPGLEWCPADGRRHGGVLFLNPGAAGPRRFRLPVCLALVRINPSGRKAFHVRFRELGGDN